MGTVLDTTVFIELERSARKKTALAAIQDFSKRLTSKLDGKDEVAIAAITASELLHGVH